MRLEGYRIMKRRSVSIIFLAIVLMTAMALSGCGDTSKGKSIEEQILGSWECNSDDYYKGGFFGLLNFYDDSTVDWDTEASDDFATWSIVNGNILKFTFNDTLSSHYSGTDKWTIEMDGDTMILTNSEGETAEYYRKTGE